MKQAAIAVAVCCALYAVVAYAQTKAASGKYVVATSGDGGVAWRLDTATGGLVYCLTAFGNPTNQAAYRPAGCTQVIQ